MCMQVSQVHEQPPPMAVLCTADAVFRALREHTLGRLVLEDDDDDDEEEEEEEEDADGARPESASSAVSEADRADGADGADARRPQQGLPNLGRSQQADGAPAHGAAVNGNAPAASTFKLQVGVAGTPEIDGAYELIEQAKEEERRLLWPRQPNFRSVLAIGYTPSHS